MMGTQNDTSLMRLLASNAKKKVKVKVKKKEEAREAK